MDKLTLFWWGDERGVKISLGVFSGEIINLLPWIKYNPTRVKKLEVPDIRCQAALSHVWYGSCTFYSLQGMGPQRAPVLSGGSSVVWRLWRVKHLCNGVWDRRISNDYLSDVNWNKAVNGDVHDLCDQCEYKVTQRSYLKNTKRISSWRGAGHLWSVRLLSKK